ncbi:MAG: MalY/PatB family protein [Roseiflexaceae bacterium]
MRFDFDTVVDRRGGDSIKWNLYGDNMLPMWVADADLKSPQGVIDALVKRAEHGIYGYAGAPAELAQLLIQRMQDLYDWTITADDLVYVPGVVTGFNIACRAVGQPGDGVLVQTPNYPPILGAAANHDMITQTAELTMTVDKGIIDYHFDMDAFTGAMTDATKIFILCHPHNPTGRLMNREQLTQMAQACVDRGVVICSDEIHCDIVLDGRKHIPTATLSPEIAQNTITLMAPSKTFNIPGLGFSFAIIQNPELRAKYKKVMAGLVPHATIFGYVGALAAYQHGQEWLDATLAYYAANRDFAIDYVKKYMPQLTITNPESTYLAWIDCGQAGIEGNPKEYFQKYGVALGDGRNFGTHTANFVRLTMACPRQLLEEGLDAMRRALEPLS